MSVPPDVLAASLAALSLNDAEVPVAHLVGDSLIDPGVPPAADGARTLRFEAPPVTVQMTVAARGDLRRLRIVVTPPDLVLVALLQPQTGVRLDLADASAQDSTAGALTCDAGPGLTSLVLRHRTDGTPLRTAWVVV